MIAFNTKCLIELTYERRNGAWQCVQCQYPETVAVEFYGEIDAMTHELRDVPNEYLPARHASFVLEMLREPRLDFAIIETLSGPLGQDGEAYAVAIEVKERPLPVTPIRKASDSLNTEASIHAMV